MAEIKKIDNQFAQMGPVCVLASYSAIINYFSGGSLSINDILNKYAEYAEIDITLSKKAKETAIKDHYHNYCIPRNMRGFDYLASVHNDNLIDTNQYCRIVRNVAGLNPILEADRLLLREEIKTDDRLAMAISLVASTNEMHARVFGWDGTTQQFFTKDPNIRAPFDEDFLLSTDIFEFILFERIRLDT